MQAPIVAAIGPAPRRPDWRQVLRGLGLTLALAMGGCAATGGLATLAPPAPAKVTSAAASPAPLDEQDMALQRARLGAGQVRTLESFAVGLGVRLGGADDGPVFAAANAAIIAAKHTGGLAVALPMGRVEATSVGLLLDNNGGYFCPAAGQCTVRAVRAPGDATASWIVRVNDPFATNLILSGITFDGAWDYARGAYAQAPETDPWLDRQGGVNITHAFNGVDDAKFIANSTVRSQVPRDHIENLVITGFAGDCLVIAGAGQNNYQNIRGEGCGGHGMVINSYDNKFSDIDFGGVGRACLFVDVNGAANHVQAKVWYCGFRLKPRDDQGVKITSGADIMDLIVQDTYGDGIWNSGQQSLITAIVSWQGALSAMDPGPISAYTCYGCEYNIVTLGASILEKSQKYPNIVRLYRDLSNGAQFGRNNIMTMTEVGWPQDYAGLWQSFWFEGPLDPSNRITLNGVDRVRYDQPGPNGMLGYATGMNGSATGTIVFGPNSPAPGKVAVLCQGADGTGCILQGFHNTAAFATAKLTSSGNFADGDTVTIAGVTYRFDAALKPAPGHVQIAAQESGSVTNLTRAINAAGGAPGVDYAAVTPPNPAVTAVDDGAHVVTVTARLAGADGDGIAVTAAAAHATWGHERLTGGAAGAQSYSTALIWDRDGAVGLPSLPGPFASPAAAAAAGVRPGYLYRDGDAVVRVLLAPGQH